jgi:hypothetical protein
MRCRRDIIQSILNLPSYALMNCVFKITVDAALIGIDLLISLKYPVELGAVI